MVNLQYSRNGKFVGRWVVGCRLSERLSVLGCNLSSAAEQERTTRSSKDQRKQKMAAKIIPDDLPAVSDISKPFLLTSRVIPPSPDGSYEFFEMTFLLPHEGIRREMSFLSKALQCINAKCLWKLRRLDQWLRVFFVPMVHEHHDLEENVIFEFYQGAVAPQSQHDEHVIVIALMDSLLVHARQGAEAVAKKDSTAAEKAIARLRKVFRVFEDYMLKHLDEEETYWPSIIQQHGAEEHDKLNAAIFAHGNKSSGIAFELAVGMVVSALGLNPQSPFPGAPWCSRDVSAQWLTNFPADPFQTKVLPRLLKQYEHYRAMIESICGEEDLALQFEHSSAPRCAVS